MARTTTTKTKNKAGAKSRSRKPAKSVAPPDRPVEIDVTPEPVTPERVRALAYDLYEMRRFLGEDGDAASDWREAERQLSVI